MHTFSRATLVRAGMALLFGVFGGLDAGIAGAQTTLSAPASLSMAVPVAALASSVVTACHDIDPRAAVAGDAASHATQRSDDGTVADDSIDPDVLAPGSGMVVIDDHGKQIQPKDYPANNGSAALARCADAMNPPPSRRSPL